MTSTTHSTASAIVGPQAHTGTAPCSGDVPRLAARSGSSRGTLHRPVSFINVLRAEARKLVDTRAAKWLLGLTVVSTLAMGGADIWLARAAQTSSSGLDFRTAVTLVQLLGSVLLPVMAILLVTAEWSQRGVLTTFPVEPRRTRVLCAKVVVALGNTLAYALLSAAVACTAMWAAGRFLHVPGMVQPGAAELARFMAADLLQTCFALALALALMAPAASIVALLVIPQMLDLLTVVSHQCAALVSWISLAAVVNGHLVPGDWSDHGVARLAVSTTLWVVLPAMVGVERNLRAEAK